MSDTPALPEPVIDAALAAWFTTEGSFTKRMRAALAAQAEEHAAEVERYKSTMIAAAEEIHAHWDAHCDAEGYGPQNLQRRLEEGIPSEYGYTAGAFARLRAERDAANKITPLLDRAEALHLNTGMHWDEARRLALSEAGIDDADIEELCSECALLGTESLLTADEIRDFARAVLVHGQALLADKRVGK